MFAANICDFARKFLLRTYIFIFGIGHNRFNRCFVLKAADNCQVNAWKGFFGANIFHGDQLHIMANYDYNKGYRWFRFEKDSAIDSSLPPLSSYRNAREVNSILWMSNAEHVANNERGHVHSDSSVISRTHEPPSLHLPILLTGYESNTSQTAPTLRLQKAADIEDGCTVYSHRNTLALPVPTPTVLMGSEASAVSHHTSVSKRTPVIRAHKARSKRTSARKSRFQPNLGTQSDLQDCLFIQNGIQCFPAGGKGFLSPQKEKDINDWINGSKASKE